MVGLTGCGKAVSTLNQDFHLNGPELMQTKSCQWYMTDPDSGTELHITLDKQYYSDGAVKSSCDVTHTQSFINDNCFNTDEIAVHYFYYDAEVVKSTTFQDLGQCIDKFYDYQ